LLPPRQSTRRWAESTPDRAALPSQYCADKSRRRRYVLAVHRIDAEHDWNRHVMWPGFAASGECRNSQIAARRDDCRTLAKRDGDGRYPRPPEAGVWRRSKLVDATTLTEPRGICRLGVSSVMGRLAGVHMRRRRAPDRTCVPARRRVRSLRRSRFRPVLRRWLCRIGSSRRRTRRAHGFGRGPIRLWRRPVIRIRVRCGRRDARSARLRPR
jgi:hypothetical protein